MGRGDSGSYRVSLDELFRRDDNAVDDGKVHYTIKKNDDGIVETWTNSDYELHRDDGPAKVLTKANGEIVEFWYQRGEINRIDGGPSVIATNKAVGVARHWVVGDSYVEGKHGFSVEFLISPIVKRHRTADLFTDDWRWAIPEGSYSDEMPSELVINKTGFAMRAKWLIGNILARKQIPGQLPRPSKAEFYSDGTPMKMVFTNSAGDLIGDIPNSIEFDREGAVTSLYWEDLEDVSTVNANRYSKTGKFKATRLFNSGQFDVEQLEGNRFKVTYLAAPTDPSIPEETRQFIFEIPLSDDLRAEALLPKRCLLPCEDPAPAT